MEAWPIIMILSQSARSWSKAPCTVAHSFSVSWLSGGRREMIKPLLKNVENFRIVSDEKPFENLWMFPSLISSCCCLPIWIFTTFEFWVAPQKQLMLTLSDVSHRLGGDGAGTGSAGLGRRKEDHKLWSCSRLVVRIRDHLHLYSSLN